jgi:hypothetical protein
MTSTEQLAPALTRPRTVAESSLDDCGNATSEVAALSFALHMLSANDCDSLAGILRERAIRRRVLLTYDEARTAVTNAPISAFWQASPYTDVGRVRTATRLLVSERHWHPDQIRDALLTVAHEVCPHPLIATKAVDAGILDGLAILKDRSEDGR